MINIKNLRVLVHPNKNLRQVAEPIDKITDEIKNVAERMFHLMSSLGGIGLAAPQVGLPWQMFVMDTKYTGKMVAINPVLSGFFGGLCIAEEGCLSLPGLLCDVSRPRIATLSGLNERGEPFCRVGKDIVSRCWFHELDHCQGVMIIDKAIGEPRVSQKRYAH